MRYFALSLFAVVALAPARAHATAEFPTKIVSTLNPSCSNPIWDGNGCTICHTTNNGGLGTATHPLGIYMKSHGLTAFNDTQLVTILQQMQSESPHTTDTNCDGKPDIDQLLTCDWQNLAIPSNTCNGGSDAGIAIPATVYYGCSTAPAIDARASEEPAVPAYAAVGFGGMLVAALVLKRRKRA